MFFRIDFIEQMGTGIGRMRDAARKANVAEPTFEFDGFFKVTFKRNAADAMSPSCVSQAIASGDQAVATADRKTEILTYIKTKGKASSSELARIDEEIITTEPTKKMNDAYKIFGIKCPAVIQKKSN
jgi:predicted HTH transcriptional regulator